jgi:HK97 family phage major capsid protein
MDIKELEGIIETASKAVNDKAADAIKKANEAFAATDELLKKYEASEAEQKELQKQLDALSTKMQEMGRKGQEPAKAVSWQAALAKEWDAKKEEIEMIVKSGGQQKGPLIFDLKDAVTVTTENTIDADGSASHYSLTENTGIISTIRKRVMTYLQNVSTGAMSKPYAMWIEELDEQGAPIFIGEGDAKTKISVRYEERQAKAKKIAVHSKISTEFMDDLPQLVSFVQNNMMRRVDIATEDQLLTGDNLGDNLKGVTEYAAAYTGGSLAGEVTAATINNWDVILGLITQVKEANGVTSGIFVTAGAYALLLSEKDTDGRYIFPPGVGFNAQGQLTAWGVRLIETNSTLGGNDFIGGDLSVINVRFRQGMRIQIGLDGNDFTNNLKTILLEQRLVQFVSANDVNVLVQGTFAEGITALSTT